jgi:hypothetical protein
MNNCTFKPISIIVGIFSFFLASAASAWTINENYDTSSNGTKCPSMGSTQSVVSSEKSASGGKSCKLKITGGKTGFGEWGGIINFPQKLKNGDEIWVRVRNYFPSGFNYNANPRLKFLRVKTLTSSGGNRGYDDWYINTSGNSTPFSFIYEGRQDLAWNHVGKSSDKIQLGKWETYEFYIKFDTKSVDEGGTGRMRAWKNGVLMEDMTDRVTLKSATDYSPSLYIYTYWNGAAPKTQSSYIDDVVITSVRPSTSDSLGNPLIGMGGFAPSAAVSPPKPPTVQ